MSIDAFKRPAIMEWQAFGLNCCVYFARYGNFNGYVQLPNTDANRLIADLHNWSEHNNPDRKFPLTDGMNIGYDALPDVQVHGGLTYGVDAQGWVGFDTHHGHDQWADEEILRWVHHDVQGYLDWLETRAIMARFTELMRRFPGMWDHEWTVEMVMAETENLAMQLAPQQQQKLVDA